MVSHMQVLATPSSPLYNKRTYNLHAQQDFFFNGSNNLFSLGTGEFMTNLIKESFLPSPEKKDRLEWKYMDKL